METMLSFFRPMWKVLLNFSASTNPVYVNSSATVHSMYLGILRTFTVQSYNVARWFIVYVKIRICNNFSWIFFVAQICIDLAFRGFFYFFAAILCSDGWNGEKCCKCNGTKEIVRMILLHITSCWEQINPAMNGVHVCVCVISCKDRQHVRVKMEEFAGNFINESQIRTISEEKHKNMMQRTLCI